MTTQHILTTLLCLALAGCVAQAVPTEGELEEQLAGKADFWGEGEGARIMADHAFTDTTMDSEAITRFLTETRESWGGPSFLASHEIDGQPFAEVLQAISEEYLINPILLLTFMQTQSGLVSRTEAPGDSELANALRCSSPARESNGLEAQLRCGARKLRGAFDTAGELEATAAGYQIDVVHSATGTSPNNRSTAAIYTYTTDGELFFLVWNQFVRHYFDQIEDDPMDWLELPYAEGFIGGACDTDDDCVFEGGICRTALNGKNVCTKSCGEATLCPDRTGYPVTLCVAGETAGMAPGGGFCMPRCLADNVCGSGFSCQGDVSRYGAPSYRRDACVAYPAATPGEEPETPVEEPTEPPTGEEEPDTPADGLTWSIVVKRIVGSEFDGDGDRWDGRLANHTPDLGALLWVSDNPDCTWERSTSGPIGPGPTLYGCAEYDWTRDYGSDTLDATLDETVFDGSKAVSSAALANGLNIQIRDHDWSGAVVMSECELGFDIDALEHIERSFEINCGAGQNAAGESVPHRIELELVRHDPAAAE